MHKFLFWPCMGYFLESFFFEFSLWKKNSSAWAKIPLFNAFTKNCNNQTFFRETGQYGKDMRKPVVLGFE